MFTVRDSARSVGRGGGSPTRKRHEGRGDRRTDDQRSALGAVTRHAQAAVSRMPLFFAAPAIKAEAALCPDCAAEGTKERQRGRPMPSPASQDGLEPDDDRMDPPRLSSEARQIMWLLLLALAVALMTGAADAPSGTVREDLPMANLTGEIAGLFKDRGGVRLRDVVVYKADAGTRTVCGSVSIRNDDGGYTDFQPLRILTTQASRIGKPLSFLVSNNDETARRVLLLCGAGRIDARRRE